MADDGGDRYDPIPRSLSREHHPDYRSVFLETYRALMTFVNTHPANDGYCRCWPSVEAVAARAGQSRRTTFEALAWLKENDYILVEQRGRKTSLYTAILRRDRFLATCKAAGRAAAIEEYEGWLADQWLEAQGRVASARSIRDEAPRPSRAGAPMCEPAHPSGSDVRPGAPVTFRSRSDVRPGAPDGCAPAHGAARRTQNDLNEKLDERSSGNEHSGLQPEPPPTALSDSKTKGNGNHDPDEIKARLRAAMARTAWPK